MSYGDQQVSIWIGIEKNTHYVCFRDGMDYHLLWKEYWGYRWEGDESPNSNEVSITRYKALTNTKRKKEADVIAMTEREKWYTVKRSVAQDWWGEYLDCGYKKHTSIPLDELEELLPEALFK